MMIETIAGIFIGFGLAASTGFRIFLPLLALSVAGYFHLVPLGVQWAWVSSSQAIIILVIATVAETLAYYIPWLDNLLDTIALPLASIAGTLVMASTMVDLDPAWQWALAIIAGGGTAGIIKGVNAKNAAGIYCYHRRHCQPYHHNHRDCLFRYTFGFVYLFVADSSHTGDPVAC